MKPGRPLDACIAEHVMGWTSIEQLRLGLSQSLHVHGTDPNGHRDDVPHYSTSIADAWKVIEKAAEGRPANISLRRNSYGERLYAVELADMDELTWSFTAPHAICLAALKAVGHEQ